ncbi:hypothetical protein P691DRAFT_807682 [Macrolepiota fuliginosa MF-IS2]|uniref:F-box domain-containing protein n=1 Tax=Macrolepiota fuliginosa MF-IS2 TaxID=1400762 RepID=A0A9P5X7K5_9AGAR|nr:hypothetical protein P691DRAFT_807682 [Macrolepiota fuliginosa MF-IS2]
MTLLHPPTIHEAALARKALTKSLDSLDSEIDCLRDRLSTLSLEQRELHASLGSYRGLLSPIRRLHPEILQEIFFHCLPTAHSAVVSADEAPLVLGRVCSRWRRVAHSTPELWASIHIAVIIPPHQSSPEVRQAIALRHAVAVWLSRSGTLPLSISLVDPDFYPHRSQSPTTIMNDQIRSYLDLIAPYAHRWRSIHFTAFRFHLMEFLNRFHTSEVPLLESLHIDGYSYDTQENIIPAISRPTNILQAPQLRVLSMPSYPPHILKSGAPLQNLTGLIITDFCSSPSQETINILGLCPNLRRCAISACSGLWWGNSYDPLPVGPVTTMIMPKLQSLAILTMVPQYVKKLLKILVTPSLRHLLISLVVRDASKSKHLYDTLSSFLRHLIDPLEELDLTYDLSGNPTDILSLVPELKRLSLTARPIVSVLGQLSSRTHDPVLVQLTPSNGWRGTPGSQAGDEPDAPTCLCPKLEVLRYVTAKFSDNELLDFLHSRTVDHRKHNASHIRMVSVHFDREAQDDIEEMDLDLRKGIEVLERETGVRVDCAYNLLKPCQEPIFDGPTTMGYSPFDGVPPMVASNTDLVIETDDYFGF